MIYERGERRQGRPRAELPRLSSRYEGTIHMPGKRYRCLLFAALGLCALTANLHADGLLQRICHKEKGGADCAAPPCKEVTTKACAPAPCCEEKIKKSCVPTVTSKVITN